MSRQQGERGIIFCTLFRMLFLKKIRAFFCESPPLVVLFLFLCSALFLGDGKQAFVEVYVGIGILCAYASTWMKKIPLSPLPRPIGLLWTAIILYFIVRTFFSDSAGYSISATVRLLEGYLVFVLFYSLSSDKVRDWLWDMLLVLCGAASVSFLVFLVFPSLAEFLPNMNLLYSATRHNHLADLLLFVLPGVTIGFVQKKDKSNTFVFVFFLFMFLLTFARGAWILYGAFLIIYVFVSRGITFKKKMALLGISGALWLMFVVLTLGSGVLSTQNNWLSGQLSKPPITNDARIEYWRQAVVAIKERPWFGSGPGTFYLQSKRLQVTPLSYSWFAHSFPLESMVELGLVGAIVTLFLAGLLMYKALRLVYAKNTDHGDFQRALFFGVFLTSAYGLYEFNLNYLIVWLLFWSYLGNLTRLNQPKDNNSPHPFSMCTHLVVVCLFVVLSVAGIVGSLLGKDRMVFFLTPFNEASGLRYVNIKPPFALSSVDEKILLFFHRHNSEILYAMGNSLSTKKDSNAKDLLTEAVLADNQNLNYHQGLLRYLNEHGTVNDVGVELKQISLMVAPSDVREQIQVIDFSSSLASHVLRGEYMKFVLDAPIGSVSLAKFYYGLGLRLVDTDPETTKKLWSIAVKMAPEWSYFFVELASLEKYLFNNVPQSRKILLDCLKYRHAAQHCITVLETHLLPVGSLRTQIFTIP